MPKGFFAKSLLLSSKKPLSRVPKCGACRLYLTCNSPKMPVSGEGRKKILVVAEAPGKQEDREGIQLVGESGQLLVSKLRKHGIEMRRDCWLTNALICRPPKNANPTADQISHCHPNLLNTLEKLKPEVIITLGTYGVKSTLKGLWRDDVSSVSQWAGMQIPNQKLNAWICPTYHPAWMLHTKKPDERNLREKFFEAHLAAATELGGRPWESIPDYESKIEKIRDPDKAAKIIREMIDQGGLAAFDYETNMLKPDSKWATIVCCSICLNGKRTIAFPWLGPAIPAMMDFLTSSRVKKIASNLKFEERWSLKEFGLGVTGWEWDTMNNAHILDGRPDITSIKFQAFVRLGIEPYDEHIKPLLQAKKGQKINQIIKEIDLNQLLLYCGMDSLLEYKVAILQMKDANHVWKRNT